MKVVVIQGPNLNMLGVRQQELYGAMSLADIHTQMEVVAKDSDVEIEFFQSNLEGEIVDKIQECLGTATGIIINPAAYSHTSIAIRDALVAVQVPCVEVHVSNIYAREDFRTKSLIAPIAQGHIAGFGPFGYHLGMISILQIMNEVQRIQEQVAMQEAPVPAQESAQEAQEFTPSQNGLNLKLSNENDNQENKIDSFDDSLKQTNQ